MTFNPYDALRRQPHVTAVWDAVMPEHGRWYERLQTLLTRRGLTQAERRCTVAHELIHAERGDTMCDWRVHRDAARLLIDMHDLGEALAMYGEQDPTSVAEELWVDEDTLRARLDHLHPSERGYLRRRLSMREHTA